MPPVHPSVLSIAAPFSGILLDAYGVFWGGGGVGVFPGAKEAMASLVAAGKQVGILSNTSQLAAKEVDKLQTHGLILGTHFHFLITSGQIAKQIFYEEQLPFKTRNKKFWLFGKQHPTYASPNVLFQDSPYTETSDLREADFMFISIPHIGGKDQTDPQLFIEEVRRVKDSGIPMVCVNPDRFAHEGNPPRPVVRQGSIAALYEEMGGAVFHIGKPSPLGFAEAMAQFRLQGIETPDNVLMIGDTPETDIRGARGYGMAAALVTKTGIMAERISTLTLQKAIMEFAPCDTPNFFIERFI